MQSLCWAEVAEAVSRDSYIAEFKSLHTLIIDDNLVQYPGNQYHHKMTFPSSTSKSKSMKGRFAQASLRQKKYSNRLSYMHVSEPVLTTLTQCAEKLNAILPSA